MKNIIYKNSLLFCLGVFCLYMSACKKSDSQYYNYVNTQQTFNGSAYSYLKAQPKGTFDSLLVVLDRYPEIIDSLQKNKVTLFAPVNKSFEVAEKYLNAKRVANGRSLINLSNADLTALRTMICKYIISGNKTTDDYKLSVDGLYQSAIITNYQMQLKYVKLSSSGYEGGGPAQINFSDPKGVIFSKYWVTTTTDAVNIKTNNATINILTPLHNFGFEEFTVSLDK